MNPMSRCYVGDEKHIWAVDLQVEPIRERLAQDRGRKRAKRFPEFYFDIELRLHLGVPRVRENRPSAQCTWTKLHSSLKPPERILALQSVDRRRDERVI